MPLLRRLVLLTRLLAPAKINLHLRVGPPTADGFHPLLTWMSTVGLSDTLHVSSNGAAGAGKPAVTLTCDDPAMPTDGRNLIVRAAERFEQSSGGGDERPRVAIHLEKAIPAGGGLGGGSSDAAATLALLNDLWGVRRPIDELARWSAAVGSDVGFFLHGGSAVCTGRGEIVRPIARPRPRAVVLFLPAFPMPTPAVYKTFDAMKLGREADVREEPDWAAWTAASAQELLPLLVNDLEPPAFEIAPQLGELREALERKVGRPVRMSGSGSTLFTLYDEPAEADQIARAVSGTCRAVSTSLAPDASSAPVERSRLRGASGGRCEARID